MRDCDASLQRVAASEGRLENVESEVDGLARQLWEGQASRR